jgi:hypothetical protein
MPRIEFVNLSLNRLQMPITSPPKMRIENLRSLVLNNTKLNWFSVEELLKLLPSLEELHLSLNEYTNVLLDTVNADDHGNNNNNDDSTCDPSTMMSTDECCNDEETNCTEGNNLTSIFIFITFCQLQSREQKHFEFIAACFSN